MSRSKLELVVARDERPLRAGIAAVKARPRAHLLHHGDRREIPAEEGVAPRRVAGDAAGPGRQRQSGLPGVVLTRVRDLDRERRDDETATRIFRVVQDERRRDDLQVMEDRTAALALPLGSA